MNKAIIIILLLATIGLWACDTKDSIAPLNANFFIKFYSGINEGDQFGEDIITTTDGGLLIAATSRNTDGSSEILLIKTDEKGNELWTYGSSELLGPTSISVAKSVIEVLDGYVVGGTRGVGNGRRSILIKINFDGSFDDSETVSTIDKDITYYNQLSKITLGHSGILVSGETLVPAVTAGDINGFIGLHDASNLDSIPSTPNGVSYKAYFGLAGDEIITGAYEVEDTLIDVINETRFLAFGSSINKDADLGYDFFFMALNSLYGIPIDIDDGRFPEIDHQTSAYVTRDGDEYWMIGETEDSGVGMFMVGWKYFSQWATIAGKEEVIGGEDVSGKGIAVQTPGNYVIVGDIIFTADHKEIHLSRVNSNRDIDDPWPKTYGTNTSTYSSSAVITLQDGSIIIVGTADLKPIKKVLVIKTGPNGEMSF